MKNMKLLTGIVLMALLFSCSKDEKSTDLTPSGGNVRLTKVTYTNTSSGSGWTDLYMYDSQNRLLKIVGNSWSEEFVYNTNGSLDKVSIISNGDLIKYKWYYSGNVVDHVVETYINDGALWNTDTTFYNYNNDQTLLINSQSIITDFNNDTVVYSYSYNRSFFYTNNRLSQLVSTNGITDYTYNSDYDLIKVVYDKVKKNNVKEGGADHYETQYSYDQKKNFIQSFKLPTEWVNYNFYQGESQYARDPFHIEECCTNLHNIIAVENAVTQFGNTDIDTYIYNIEEYNSSGYPVRIREEHGIFLLSYENI